MGLGGTAKKLQTVVNAAEELYAKMNEVIGELKDLRSEVEQTSQQVDALEYEVAEQRAILDAIADAEGVDVEAVLDDADLPSDPAEESTEETAADATSQDSSATGGDAGST
jgi:DNA anti-recombination protein RmuC